MDINRKRKNNDDLYNNKFAETLADIKEQQAQIDALTEAQRIAQITAQRTAQEARVAQRPGFGNVPKEAPVAPQSPQILDASGRPLAPSMPRIYPARPQNSREVCVDRHVDGHSQARRNKEPRSVHGPT